MAGRVHLWQVTLCEPIWQVTSRSSEMGFPGRAISAFFIEEQQNGTELKIND